MAEVAEVVTMLLGGWVPGVAKICPKMLKSLDIVD